MRKHMIREACRQFMERKRAEFEGKGKTCPDKEAAKVKDRTPSATPSTSSAASNESVKSSDERPWDQWQAWQHSLQQIYSVEDSSVDGFELIDNAGDHPPSTSSSFMGFRLG